MIGSNKIEKNRMGTKWKVITNDYRKQLSTPSNA